MVRPIRASMWSQGSVMPSANHGSAPLGRCKRAMYSAVACSCGNALSGLACSGITKRRMSCENIGPRFSPATGSALFRGCGLSRVFASSPTPASGDSVQRWVFVHRAAKTHSVTTNRARADCAPNVWRENPCVDWSRLFLAATF